MSAAPVPFAAVLNLERRLARELQHVRRDAVAAARGALKATDPLRALDERASRGLLPRPLRRRVAKLVGQLVRQGRADQQAEIDAHRRRRREFALTVEREKEPSRVDEADVALYHQVAAQMVDQLSAEQYSLLRGGIEAGLRAGETEVEMGARLDRLELGLARQHCDTWARTESTRYYTLGRVETVEAADDVWGYEFVVIVDNRTTEICRAFVGKRVSKAKLKKFPPFHYNCRTTVRAVFFDEAPEVDDELGPEARPDEGFGDDPREMIQRAKGAEPLDAARRRRAQAEAAPPPPEPPDPPESSFLPPPTPGWQDLPTLDLAKVDLHKAEKSWKTVPGHKNTYGAVIFDDEGRVLIREPKGHFGGYTWTWPKGSPDSPDAHPFDVAWREVLEETGYKFEPVGLVPGRFEGTTSDAFMFIGRVTAHQPEKMAWETDQVRWVSLPEAMELLGQSTNEAGKKRDIDILTVAAMQHNLLLKGQVDPSHLNPAKHPWPPVPKQPKAPPAKPKSAKTKPAKPVAPPAPASPPPPPEPPKAKAWPAQQSVTPPPQITLPDGRKAVSLGGQSGSNPAAWYETDDGQRLYVKFPNATHQVPAERVTRQLAKAMGLPAPDGEVLDLPEGVAIVTPRMELQQLSPAQLRKKAKTERAAHLVHAAWTRNWDVVGLNYDNLLLGPGKKLIVVDHGGALLWRAQGGLKPGGMPAQVEELETLRFSGKNAQAADVFGNLDDPTVAKAIRKHVKDIRDDDIAELVRGQGFSEADEAAIVTGLRERREWLLEWADGVLGTKRKRQAAARPGRPPNGYSGHPEADGWTVMPSDLEPRAAYDLIRQRRWTNPEGQLGSKTMSSQNHWPADRPAAPEEALPLMRELTGGAFNDEQLVEMARSIQAFTGSQWKNRAVQKQCRDFCRVAPGFRGQVARGVDLDIGPDGFGDPGRYTHKGGTGLSEGQIIKLSRVESFSAGKEFEKNTLVVLERNTHGPSIRGLSGFLNEHEVLVGPDTELRVKRILKYRLDNGRRKTIIFVEETDPIP